MRSRPAAPTAAVTPDEPTLDVPTPNVPPWALVLGTLLIVVFVGLSIEAYAGISFLGRARALFPDQERLAAGAALRVFYTAGETAQVGQAVTGSRAQQRTLQSGDTVLLGGSRRLVRVEAGGQTTSITADVGATVTAVNLGAWDADAGRLVGLLAHRTDAGWSVDSSGMPVAGSDLFASGGPEEELGEKFWLNPSESAGRIRRGTEDGGPVVRVRANRGGPYLGIESAGPLPALENAVVTVRAVVRARGEGPVGLTIFDAIDAGGAFETSADSRPAREDGWTELTVRRRMTRASAGDKLSIGLYQVRSGDWIEVRELKTYLGAFP